MSIAMTKSPNNRRALRTSLMLGAMSPVERQMGRYMRAPDDHVADPAPAPSPTPAPTPAPTPKDDADGKQPSDPAKEPPAEDGSGPTALGGGDPEDVEPPVVEGPPEAYDLATEGVDLDAESLADAEPVFREIGLTNDNARKLVPVAAKFAERVTDRTVNTIVSEGNAQRKAWLDGAKAAEDIGGANWDKSLHVAARGLDALGFKAGHPFRQALEGTGFGNHPDMIRMAVKLGELVGEDGDFVRADASAPARDDVKKRLYPNDVKE